MGVISDHISEQKIKRKISKLEDCRKDITDDSGDVNAINKNFDSLISDLQSFLGASGSARLEELLYAMKESDQYSDPFLAKASIAIRNEIRSLKSELEDDGGSCK